MDRTSASGTGGGQLAHGLLEFPFRSAITSWVSPFLLLTRKNRGVNCFLQSRVDCALDWPSSWRTDQMIRKLNLLCCCCFLAVAGYALAEPEQPEK